MIPKSKTHEEQLLKWLNGTSTHCYFGYGKEDYECCPDFSCCHPTLLRTRDERQHYYDAPKLERERTLANYLEAFLTKVSVEH